MVEVVQYGAIVASTTADAAGTIQPPIANGVETQLVVNTGKRLRGQPGSISPARDQVLCQV